MVINKEEECRVFTGLGFSHAEDILLYLSKFSEWSFNRTLRMLVIWLWLPVGVDDHGPKETT